MSNLDDTYGPFPGRPDHPDMQTLSEIVVALDNQAEAVEKFDFAAHVNKTVDVESLVYLGMQRGLRIGFTLPGQMQAAASLYCDAFLTGAEFGKRRAAEAADAATVAEVFGDEPTD